SQEAADQLGVDASEAFGSGVAGTEASEAEPGRGRTRGRRPAKPAAGLAGVDADGSGRSSPAGPGTDGPGERRPSLFEPRSVSQEAADQLGVDASDRAASEAFGSGVAGTEASEAEPGLAADAPGGRRPRAFEPRSVSQEAATPGLADLDAGGSGRAGADKQGV